MSDDLLVELLQALDAPQHTYCELDRYYNARQPLAFLSPEAKVALGNRFGRVASNLCRLAVNSLAERLRIRGFSGVDVWPEWLANDLDLESSVLHREALLFGDGFVIVWSGPDGSPRVSVESAQQVTVLSDPGTREVTSAVKRWRTKTTTEAIVYLPDRIEHHRANTPGAATAGYSLVEVLDNPLGVVPVVEFRNSERVLGAGHSEIVDLMPLVDGLNKTLADLAIAQEYNSRPRRWATGVELIEEPILDAEGNPVIVDGEPLMRVVSPIPESNRAMISAEPDTRFGQLPGADLVGFENAVGIWLGQIMAVSCLPAHYVGITTNNPASAEAIRGAETSLTARAEARQQVFGRSWERVARLMAAVKTGADPASFDVSVVWGDPASRSIAAEADSAVKLYQSKILSRAGTLRKLGFSEQEISDEIKQLLDEIGTETAAQFDPLAKQYIKDNF